MAIAHAYLNDIRYGDFRLSYIEKMSRIRKEDVVAFACRYMHDNSVIINKRQGPAGGGAEVNKPPITPSTSTMIWNRHS